MSLLKINAFHSIDKYICSSSKGLFFVAFLSSCFGIMSAFSPNFEMLLFLRTLMGFTAGGSAQGYVTHTLILKYL